VEDKGRGKEGGLLRSSEAGEERNRYEQERKRGRDFI
jgi:hypothetical protein